MPNRRETFCAKSFDRYLAHQLDGPLPCWTTVPQGQDPPDFFLTIQDEAYAVVVTSTQVLRESSAGQTPVNEETFEATHHEIATALEDAARTRGYEGSYVLSFDEPISSLELRDSRSALIAELLGAISRSQREPVSWSASVGPDNGTLCRLLKVEDGEIHVLEESSYGAWIDSPRFMAFVSEVLRHAVIRKRESLRRKQVSQPSILLLMNTYYLADLAICASCMEAVREKDAFHAIFVVQPDGSGCVVHSKQAAWLCGSQVGAA
jgi:hypothetical protein